MPIPSIIATAAENYRFNSEALLSNAKSLTLEDWLNRPGGKGNHIAWIAGHLIWTRGRLLGRLGTTWSQPWLDLFARGAQIENASQYPTPETLLDAWREVSGVLADTLANTSEEQLAQPVTQGPPSTDGKLSGVVNFLAMHESQHMGQIIYLRCWLGHK